jgi:4-amino-4-deoxy-L-arabinose transferase-like glycosyltransferase
MADPPFTSANQTSAPAFLRHGWQDARTSCFWIVLIAFSLRLLLILVGHTYKFRTTDDNFSFGWEMGRIGQSLARAQGFSSPFNQVTGPTAWESPLYPFLIAGVFRLFGIYTHASAIVLLGVNSIFSALTCIPIFLIAQRCFGKTVAAWTAWLWALLPFVMYWCTRWVWETSLAAFLLTLIFWLALALEEREGLVPWVEFGLLWGIAALTNTSLLAFLPASGLWTWYHRRKRGKRSLRGAVVASVVFFACITPWIVRNYEVFGKFIFIRSNLGAELRIGNGPGADGTWQEYLHPTQNVYEMRRYRELGEVAYVATRKREASIFIQDHFAEFLWLSVKRFIYYWGGVPKQSANPALEPFTNSAFLASSVLALWGLGRALRRRKPGAGLFLWLIVCYPAIFYFVFPHPRYRHPIEPELAILIVYVISEADSKAVRKAENRSE